MGRRHGWPQEIGGNLDYGDLRTVDSMQLPDATPRDNQARMECSNGGAQSPPRPALSHAINTAQKQRSAVVLRVHGDRLDIQGAISCCVGLDSSIVRSVYALGDTGNTGGLGRVVCWLAILRSVAVWKSNGILAAFWSDLLPLRALSAGSLELWLSNF